MSMQFVRATSVSEARSVLVTEGANARLLAGGTDLLVNLRRGRPEVGTLVAVSHLPELGMLESDGSQVRIGAGVSHRMIERSPLFLGAMRALPEACATVGSIQIRNVGTLAGNVCNASPAADTPPVLLAFDARVVVAGADEDRMLPLEAFFTGYRATALMPGELLREIRIPRPPRASGSAFEKIGRRKAMEISVACVAAMVSLGDDGRTLRSVRIGLGSVSATSVRARGAESLLAGKVVTAETLRAAGEVAAREIAPIDDLRAGADYRRSVVAALVARAVARASDRAKADLGSEDEDV